MLTGKRVDLKVLEQEDIALWHDWFNDPEFAGPSLWFPRQSSLQDAEKNILEPKPGLDHGRFLIVTKEGKKVGGAMHFNPSTMYDWTEIGFRVLASERGRGYATEAAQILVDYLFLSRNLERIQATTEADNLGSQKVLLKVGFRKEGDIRRGWLMWGRWRDGVQFSIVREDWKGPRVLRNLDGEAQRQASPPHDPRSPG